MANSSIFSRVAAVTALTLPLIFAANANAGGLVPTQCYDKAVAKTVLRDEGQDIIIAGSRLTSSKERPPNAFYLNKQGYGYNIEIDTKSGLYCVADAYKNARLNNPNNPQIPTWATGIKGNGADISKAYNNGGRFVFVAQSYRNRSDGSEVDGKYIAVLLGTKDADGSVWSIDSDGRPDGLFDMERAGITQYMADLINGSPLAAAYAPPRLAMR